MKIVCSKNELLKAMQMIQPIVSSKITLPVLANFLVEAKKKGNRIKFSATNLEVAVEFYIEGKVEKEGSITIPIRQFFDIVKEVPDCDIEIRVEDTKIKIKAQKSKFILVGIISEDYPVVPQIKKDESLLLNLQVLKNLFRKTIFCVSKDIQKYVITGVCFATKDKEINCIATDGRRLSFVKNVCTNTNSNVKVIIPAKSVEYILKNFDFNENKDIKIYISNNLITFELNNFIFKTKLIEGTFPDYERILQWKKISKIIINTEEMLSAVKQISAIIERRLSFNESLAIKLNFENNKIVALSNSSMAGFGETEVMTDYVGNSFSISVNPDYLKDILQNIEDENFEFIYCDSKQPIIIKLKDINNFIHLIMPVI
jgi:DNA polymerase-3 subunit beta